MTKDELIEDLKKYKENIASLKLKKKSLRKKEKKLKTLQKQIPETSLGSATGINNDIRSKNKVGNKVESAVVNKLTEIEELKEDIIKLKENIFILKERTEDVRIRLEALSIKEYKFVEAYYFQGRTYEEIGNILYFELYKQTRDKDTIRNIVERAIQKMMKL